VAFSISDWSLSSSSSSFFCASASCLASVRSARVLPPWPFSAPSGARTSVRRHPCRQEDRRRHHRRQASHPPLTLLRFAHPDSPSGLPSPFALEAEDEQDRGASPGQFFGTHLALLTGRPAPCLPASALPGFGTGTLIRLFLLLLRFAGGKTPFPPFPEAGGTSRSQHPCAFCCRPGGAAGQQVQQPSVFSFSIWSSMSSGNSQPEFLHLLAVVG
jgi:hypothetical protein